MLTSLFIYILSLRLYVCSMNDINQIAIFYAKAVLNNNYIREEFTKHMLQCVVFPYKLSKLFISVIEFFKYSICCL